MSLKTKLFINQSFIVKRSCVVLFIISGLFLLQGCLSTAHLSRFSKDSKDFDFQKIAQSKKADGDKAWNTKTGFEYYIKTSVVDSSLIEDLSIRILLKEGFQIKVLDRHNGVVIGERGLQANEWKTITGIYYKKDSLNYDIYIKSIITQDITGGWKQDRAQEVGEAICTFLISKCLAAYSVNTQQK